MRVLSLFDGISCGQVALNRADISYKKYYASEIESSAIKVTNWNYPDTIQLGDVTELDLKIKPDLLLAGSPCTNLSKAGDRTGLDGTQSKLFWDFLHIWKQYPGIPFLLENVPMDLKSETIISEALDIEPVIINSNLFSAQNRQRLYWTNILIPPLPTTNTVVVDDILQEQVAQRYMLSPKALSYMNRTFGNVRRWNKFANKAGRKSHTIVANFKKGVPHGVIITDQNLAEEIFMFGYDGQVDQRLRRFTPVETERLQTLEDNYTACIAPTNRYAAIGNGWTVDVISHILSGLK